MSKHHEFDGNLHQVFRVKSDAHNKRIPLCFWRRGRMEMSHKKFLAQAFAWALLAMSSPAPAQWIAYNDQELAELLGKPERPVS